MSVHGFAELYGYLDSASLWLVCGWVAHDQLSAAPIDAILEFDAGSVTGPTRVAFYERPDLGEQGAGMVVAVSAGAGDPGKLLGVELRQDGAGLTLRPTDTAAHCAATVIAAHARSCLQARPPAQGGRGTDREALRKLLAVRRTAEGYLDLYGYHPESGGAFIVGWVAQSSPPSSVVVSLEASKISRDFAGGDTGALINFHAREDLHGKGRGFVLHVPDLAPSQGAPLAVTLQADGAEITLPASSAMRAIPARDSTPYFASVVGRSDPGPARDALMARASKHRADGSETQAELASGLLIDIDEAIACPPDSLVLCGWMLARPDDVRAIRLRAGGQTIAIDRAKNWWTLSRPDVIATIGETKGFDDPACGFIVRVPLAGALDADAQLEIETGSGETVCISVPPRRLTGIAAIKRLLGSLDVQYTDLDRLFDHILGPPVAALNAERLRAAPEIAEQVWGALPSAPHASVIIPLHGRIDFIEYQMAFFAAYGIGEDVEIIYVLDDPPRTRETQFLCASVFARFAIPFRLLCLSRNLGFAPANRIGLQAASGDYVCFMNSDVFPTDGSWLHRLTGRLAEDASLGAVGPTLLYEDGTLQHGGIDFKRLPQYGAWWFPQHPRKGWRPDGNGGIRYQRAITGACMVLRRGDAIACDGFDSAFVIGDFEDTDLCFKLAQRQLRTAVDRDVTLYHLERQSQAASGSPWRTNLTIYNAWLHQRRWGDLIANALQA
jgi:GT2 family glycosyltransferase